MSFPFIWSSTAGADSSVQFSRILTLPNSGGWANGDLAYIMFANDTSVMPSISSPSGWNSSFTGAAPNNAARLTGFYRFINGTSGELGNVTVATSGGRASSWVIFQIQNVSGTTVPSVSVNASGSGINPDSPEHTAPWADSYDTLWISVVGADGSGLPTAYPTNYNFGHQSANWNHISGCHIATAARQFNPDSGNTTNPGSFTMNTSQEWSARTIAIMGP